MVLTKQQIERIKEIINNYFNSFIFKNIGSSELSSEDIKKLKQVGMTEPQIYDLFKDAFILGKYQGNVGGEQLKSANHNEFKSEIFKKPIELTAQDQYALDHIKQSAGEYITNLKNKVSNRIVGEILANNREAHLDMLGDIIKPTFEQALIDQKNISELASDLREKTKDVVRDWEKIAKTELGNAHNYGSMNAILDRNKDQNKKDILAYKSGPLDQSTCQFCKEFWHDGSSFKIYRLIDLIANGDNHGKKQAQWLPTIGLTHPFCRHRLIELPQGWTLNDEGQLEYVGPEHHELDSNLKKKK